MSQASNTPISPKAKTAHRREEKRLLLELAARAESLAQPRMNHAERDIGRMLLMQTINNLVTLSPRDFA